VSARLLKKRRNAMSKQNTTTDLNATLNMDDLLNMDFDQMVVDSSSTGSNDTKIFSKDDPRIWKPDYKSEGIYQFYFLPSIKDKTVTQKFSTHSVKYFDDGKAQSLYGICPKQTGGDCPLCDYGWKMMGRKGDGTPQHQRDAAKNWLPQQSEYCNILMVKDPKNEDNNGKVFLYKIPKVIKELIDERVTVSEKNATDEEFIAFNPFKFSETAKFKLDVETDPKDPKRTKYTKSKFMVNSKKDLGMIAKTKEEVLAILNETHNLTEAVAEYVEAKILTVDKIMKTPKIGDILSGNGGSTGTETPETISADRGSGSVDVDNSASGVSDADADFLDGI